MLLRELLDILNSLITEPCVKDYGELLNNDVVFGDLDNEVTGIVTVWKPTKEIIEKAIELNVNTIISHEALFYELDPYPLVPPRNTFTIKSNREKIKLLDKYNMNVIRLHTSWDDALDGNDDTTAKLLGAKIIERLPCSRVVEFTPPLTAKELAEKVREKLKAPFVIFVGKEEKLIRRALIVAGAGAKRFNFADLALRKGLDAIISGDSTADTWDFVAENDLVLIDPTHAYSEQWGMKSLAEKLKEKVNVPVYFLESKVKAKILTR